MSENDAIENNNSNISNESLKEAQQILETYEGLERLDNSKEILKEMIAEALDKAFSEGIDCEKAVRRLNQILNNE